VLVSHLLFVNDTLIFCKPHINHLGYLRHIPVLFEVMSELKINLSTSILIPIGEVLELNLAHFFGCGVDFLPSPYLGLPLGASYNSKLGWNLNYCLEKGD